mmetsp:Transcript_37478/g.99610  ORF Transcript_37478/g.99610 Transcript_37478/m.99610 type:complete len:217 (+) Transcript_37478:96-746(+)
MCRASGSRTVSHIQTSRLMTALGKNCNGGLEETHRYFRTVYQTKPHVLDRLFGDCMTCTVFESDFCVAPWRLSGRFSCERVETILRTFGFCSTGTLARDFMSRLELSASASCLNESMMESALSRRLFTVQRVDSFLATIAADCSSPQSAEISWSNIVGSWRWKLSMTHVRLAAGEHPESPQNCAGPWYTAARSSHAGSCLKGLSINRCFNKGFEAA